MKVLYFASLREKIGKDSEEITGFSNSDELKNHLIKKYPNCFDDNIITAINMEVINENTVLNSNDEVAFYPPVTGG